MSDLSDFLRENTRIVLPKERVSHCLGDWFWFFDEARRERLGIEREEDLQWVLGIYRRAQKRYVERLRKGGESDLKKTLPSLREHMEDVAEQIDERFAIAGRERPAPRPKSTLHELRRLKEGLVNRLDQREGWTEIGEVFPECVEVMEPGEFPSAEGENPRELPSLRKEHTYRKAGEGEETPPIGERPCVDFEKAGYVGALEPVPANTPLHAALELAQEKLEREERAAWEFSLSFDAFRVSLERLKIVLYEFDQLIEPRELTNAEAEAITEQFQLEPFSEMDIEGEEGYAVDLRKLLIATEETLRSGERYWRGAPEEASPNRSRLHRTLLRHDDEPLLKAGRKGKEMEPITVQRYREIVGEFFGERRLRSLRREAFGLTHLL